jgi:hypothetical protein
MSLKVPAPFSTWNPGYQTRVNQALEVNDLTNRKKGSDVELDKEKLILHSAPGGVRWQITVTDAGVLQVVAVP